GGAAGRPGTEPSPAQFPGTAERTAGHAGVGTAGTDGRDAERGLQSAGPRSGTGDDAAARRRLLPPGLPEHRPAEHPVAATRKARRARIRGAPRTSSGPSIEFDSWLAPARCSGATP